MHPILEKLLALQQLQLRMANLHQQLLALPDVLKQAQAELELARNAEEQAQRKCQQAEADIKTHDRNLAAIRQRRQSLKAKSGIIRSHDYQTAVQQLAQCDIDVKEQEELQLQAMMALESAQETLRQKQQLAAASAEHVEHVKEQTQQRHLHFQQQLAELKEELPQRLKAVPAEILGEYKRLRLSPRFPATTPVLVPILNQTCSACHLGVTQQVLNKAASGNTVVHCPSCGLMLYDGSDDL